MRIAEIGRLAGDRDNRAKALWFEEARTCVLRDEPLPPPGPKDATVRALFSGISRGTEALVFEGHVPESEYDRMQGPHQGGKLPFPVKYGYAVVGVVEEGPAELSGRTVFCLHPHQDRFRVEASAVHPVPEDVPAGRAVLAANMETALNIVWDAGILPGDRVAVFGAGVVGLLTAYIASRIPGTETVICDTSPVRGTQAGALGLAFALPQEGPVNCDVLVNASAAPEALAGAIDHAGFEAKIVEASWYGDRLASLCLGGAFHARRLSIVSSQVGSVAAGRRARWNPARRLRKALDLLADERLDVLISGETPFADIAEPYPGIIASPDTLCHRIRY
ncbi:dehydrogenase [Pseudorhizobium endolithicum]|uniref:Dehydrogenase n=1 Tax=Pseudorhizobium endolithicum TaxID=1191678 RepID=A0ABM8PN74_9HYPH|nr:zinc-binding alcohol dehydrogenase [Pseudorhizobium endolithicum]CAD7038951.1 dehydrogenase [Pseudorhizobium endolithicum]